MDRNFRIQFNNVPEFLNIFFILVAYVNVKTHSLIKENI